MHLCHERPIKLIFKSGSNVALELLYLIDEKYLKVNGRYAMGKLNMSYYLKPKGYFTGIQATLTLNE